MGTISLIIAVMELHSASAEVLKNACGLLQNLANGSAKYKIDVANAGGIESGVAAMQICASCLVTFSVFNRVKMLNNLIRA